MCIIVSKGKGVAMPSKTILQNCFNRNKDGAGLMYVNKGNVVIRKGFMTFKDFYDYIEKLERTYDLTEKALVMHFRISTGGNVDAGNCHPYPVTADAQRLRCTRINTTLGMAHNGIISDYSRKDKVLNDTQCFVRDCVSVLYEYDNEFYNNPRVMNMLKDVAGSKLCFLDANENIYYIGDFVEDEGIMYSNTTYKTYYSYPATKYVYNKKTKKYEYLYDDYDDYYDSYYGGGYYGSKGYGYGSEYSSYSDAVDEEAELEKYDSIIADKVMKADHKLGNATEPLTKKEFDFLMEYITILNKGDLIDSVEGEFVVDDDKCYGIDNWFNVYFIDYDNHDLYVIYEDVLYTPVKDVKTDDTKLELAVVDGE